MQVSRFSFVALGAALAIGGCSNDFAPYSQLDRLRVLAIASEPATPLPGQTATVSALTFAPAGEAVTYRWSWCPVTAAAAKSYVCPLDQAQASAAFAGALDPAVAATVPSLDLGSEGAASFTNPFSLAALAQLCAAGLSSAGYQQGLDCEGGYPVTVVLDVATATASLRAGFVLRLPVGAAPELNRNPAPTALRLSETILADTTTVVALTPAQGVDTHVDFPDDTIEIRSIPPSEGAPGLRPERLVASWFADSGKFDDARTSFIDGLTTLDQAKSNRWTAPAADAWTATGEVTFAVVLRDDRGGVGWIVRHVRLERAP